VSLLAPTSTVSSPVPLVETQDFPAPRSVRDFRYVYTHCSKIPASEPVPVISSLVDDSPPPPSTFPSDLDILIAF